MKYQVRVSNTDVVLLETDNYNDAINCVKKYVDIDSKFNKHETGHYVVVDMSQDKTLLAM